MALPTKAKKPTGQNQSAAKRHESEIRRYLKLGLNDEIPYGFHLQFMIDEYQAENSILVNAFKAKNKKVCASKSCHDQQDNGSPNFDSFNEETLKQRNNIFN